MPPEAAGPRARTVWSFGLVLALGLVVLTVLGARGRLYDPDLWWHLRLGQEIWTTHTVPRQDLLSFTTGGHAYLPHEWLAQTSIYAAWALGGYGGLEAWLCGFASLTFLLVYARCARSCGSRRVAFLGGLLAWYFATVGLAVRPLVLGHLCFAAELLLLELGRSGRRLWLWLLPPLFALWVNCHGSYVVGLAVLAVQFACAHRDGRLGSLVWSAWEPARRRALGLATGFSAAALLLNPAGPRLLWYPFNTLFQQTTNLQAVEEWMPLSFAEGRGMALFAVLAAVFLLVLVRHSAIRIEELLVLALTAVMALRHTRMLYLFGIAAAPVLCRLLKDAWPDGNTERRGANAALSAAAVALIIWTWPSGPELHREAERQAPRGAVEYIRQARLSGPMLNSYGFGGYLIWELREHPVFIDGRGDIFDWSGVLAAYGNWATLREDPARLLDRYGIRFCVLARHEPMARVMPYLPGWKGVYADEAAAVFVRERPPAAQNTTR